MNAEIQVLEGNTSSTLSRQEMLLSDLSTSLVLEHIRIGYPESVYPYADANSVFVITQRLQELVLVDIIRLLQISDNREETMRIYLTQCSDMLQRAGILINDFNSDIEDLDADVQICAAQKSDADKRYSQALSMNDQKSIDVAVADSQKWQTCVSQKRIEASAKQGILNKISYYTAVLQRKYDYMFTRQDLIVKYFPIMEEQLLETLQGITTELGAYIP